ncbi:hypothetical protein RchiOBHm_Chr2g0158471 [Rosa chinensis]|uniref:Uncharacterized protein n=1 Tax=Rosa chinensis TaxID=74649 RepID=A0A2P6S223_ROSCH|nr:uncharacterized protein LOC112188433 [Rosa chinensis]PRQ52715.1 hypothetical protein RchiOBHm_Chr2g0158471 [Rosa chinensis]
MSFLAGRLAGKEGAYFFQESKQAVGRLVSRKGPAHKKLPSAATEQESQADVLPEVLRHSLPPRIYHQQPEMASSLDTASKWVLKSDSKNPFSISSQTLNPLRDYVSLPQVTFGPKRWQLPESENSMLASTANELRRDRHPTPINPEKFKAAAEGLTRIGVAFAIATAIVFGGATLVIGMAVSKLQVQNSDDIRTKGKDLVEPKFEEIREQLVPLKAWVENMSRKWHLEKGEDVKEKPLIKSLSKMLGAKTSNRQ